MRIVMTLMKYVSTVRSGTQRLIQIFVHYLDIVLVRRMHQVSDKCARTVSGPDLVVNATRS